MPKTITFNDFEPLDPARHSREGFKCGVAKLDNFLKKQARKESPDLSVTFVLTCAEEVGQIMGFYSLSATQLRSDDLKPALMKRIGHYGSVPATLLGRLAVAERYQGIKELRIGEKLLIDAMLKTHIAARNVGSFGLIVDVLKSEKGDPTGFYEKYGFVKCQATDGRMYMVMQTLEQILRTAELLY